MKNKSKRFLCLFRLSYIVTILTCTVTRAIPDSDLVAIPVHHKVAWHLAVAYYLVTVLLTYIFLKKFRIILRETGFMFECDQWGFL